MCRTQLKSRTGVALLWLFLTTSCDKNSAEPCINGECCWSGYRNTVLQQVEGKRAGFLGNAFLFEDQVFGADYNTAMICSTQIKKLQDMNLENNFTTDYRTGKARLVDSTRLYPYKVWGTVYIIDIPNTLVATRGFHVDRIEKVQ